MDKHSKIFVAGHKGLVGSAILRYLQENNYTNIITATRQEVDLCNQQETAYFFNEYKPEYVFLSAAKVGGIMANNSYPADFIYQNLCIQNNVIINSYKQQVKRLIFLGSSCIYPKKAAQPIKEESLLSGYLEPTNSAYALAKIAGVEMCRSFNKQFNTQYIALMPCNLYGINDNYNLNTSHVLPALIRKIHTAQKENTNSVEIWGTGNPLREFLFADNLAEACVFIAHLGNNEMNTLLKNNYYPLLNIGSGIDISIKDLALTIAELINFKGTFTFNTSRPDGTLKKLLDISKIKQLGWTYKTDLKKGIQLAYQDFLDKLQNNNIH